MGVNPIERAIDILGSAAALARACKQKPQAVTRWRRTGRIPAHHAGAIEKATHGRVTKADLRPDLFGQSPTEQAA
jgi:DNA-binding transcriptional regulator YdaS (Cro superfamily)